MQYEAFVFRAIDLYLIESKKVKSNLPDLLSGLTSLILDFLI